MSKKKRQEKIDAIKLMSDEQMKKEMTEIITQDIVRFLEIVTRKRVGLFVDEIYNGIKRRPHSHERRRNK